MAMEKHARNSKRTISVTDGDGKFDLDTLLHPANAFSHPAEVVRDRDMTLNEKRAILAAWASDACAIEAAPELRINGAGNVVRFDDIMDALRLLDREAAKLHVDVETLRRARKRWRSRTGGGFGQGAQLG
jgi:hypothetical protein